MPTARPTNHELAARLHSANGRIARAKHSGAVVYLDDAQAIIKDVIADLMCGETTAKRMAHRTMPVIPRDDNPPTDPNIPTDDTLAGEVIPHHDDIYGA